MKTQLTLLTCLLAAPLVQAEIATIKFDHIQGDWAYFSNEPTFVTPDGGSYSYVPYFNEGWDVLRAGTRRRTMAYVISTRNSSWTPVQKGAFSFEYRLAYMSVKLRDRKEDKYTQGQLSTIGCAARTKDGIERGEANTIFSQPNSNGQKSQIQTYWSLAQNGGNTYYIACNPSHVNQYEGEKETRVVNSYLAFEFRVARKMATAIPDSVIIPASSHLVERYGTETDRNPLTGRDITFNIDKTKYPMVFNVKRTPQSDITINYNRKRDGHKTVTKETLFKIDMMVGGWWDGHVAITPTCTGDKHLCGSISNIAIQSLAAHWNTIFHNTKLGKPVKLLNQAPSSAVSDQDWKIKVDFSNLNKIPATQAKRSSQIYYHIEASI